MTEDDWNAAFVAIEGAMNASAQRRSTTSAISEAERQGLIKQTSDDEYKGKVWEAWKKESAGTTLVFRWRYYDTSHAWATRPDMNILFLELRQNGKTTREAELRFED
jgi:hypothetical protein